MRDGIWKAIGAPHWQRLFKEAANPAACAEPGHLREEALRAVIRETRPDLQELRVYSEMAQQRRLSIVDPGERLTSPLLRRALEHAERTGNPIAGLAEAMRERVDNQLRSARAVLREESRRAMQALSRVQMAVGELSFPSLAGEALHDGKISGQTPTRDVSEDARNVLNWDMPQAVS